MSFFNKVLSTFFEKFFINKVDLNGCRGIFIPSFTFQVSPIKYFAKALSTFHQINAFEEGGFLIIDMCASDDGRAITNYKVQNLRKSGEALDEVSVAAVFLMPATMLLFSSFSNAKMTVEIKFLNLDGDGDEDVSPCESVCINYKTIMKLCRLSVIFFF